MCESCDNHQSGCGCDDGFDGLDRRDFLTAMGAAVGALTFSSSGDAVAAAAPPATAKKGSPAVVRVAFLYPPSMTFANDSNGWWSWPGNEFDAEARQKQYTVGLRDVETRYGMKLDIGDQPVATAGQVEQLAAELGAAKPDGLLLIMFYNRALPLADTLLKAAADLGIPAILFIGLGVKHGRVGQYRRPGVHFIQSLDNLEAIETGLRMIHTRKRMSQARLLSITEAPARREGVEKFFGTTVRVVPFAEYADRFAKIEIDSEAKEWIKAKAGGASEIRGVDDVAMRNAARAHFALKQMLAEHDADGVAMNCLRRGMLKPCMSFSSLNDQLIPATCENDLPAMYTNLLGQLLIGRPGFQHNPCFETEANHYYASHCTCATKLHGPDSEARPYLLRRFAHTNEGSCAIQVFWKPDDPVTMVRYYPGKEPALDVYAGRVVVSHPMPPAAGCTTNVEIAVTDRPDACMVSGHHNLLFAGDFARTFRRFAQLYGMRLAETGYDGPWPI